MKFAVIKEHRDFFNKHGMIEFEQFFNLDQIQLFNQAINQALSNRTSIDSEKWRQLSSEQLFLNGRDLWRSSAELRQLVCQPRLAAIASELIEKKPLRLGYDQLFPSRHQAVRHPIVQEKPSIYGQFLNQSTTLKEISSINGLLCGLMIALSSSQEEKKESKEELVKPSIFPTQAGHVTFFQPTFQLNLEELYQHPHQRFYLIVYTQGLAQYELQPKDPHTYALKHLGYTFHTNLSDKLNPIVYR
jgi:hypothetical protein